ncbi:cyclin-F2-2-like [Oryza brachyantha]|uniref:cyclin-F2-2-like n=1 Tax=Oryza brachyantha TaxID=4533 RepID=UPI001ADCBF6B|nr:cyclin-F2-2-like [Oryza brachyantha]
MDTMMNPYIAELLADDITASMIGVLYGGGGGHAPLHTDIDTYLRAIGAVPALPEAPGEGYAVAAEMETLMSYDDANGVFYDCYTEMDVGVPARLPPPLGFPSLPVPALDGDEPVYAAPARLPPPPGFPPLPLPAQAAEPLYAAPVGEGHGSMEQLVWSEQHDDAPVSDNSMASRRQLCAPYDDDIDTTLRAMEKDAAERPSPEYLTTVHGGRISADLRAALVAWMDRFTQNYDLAAGTLHRAVSYVDRFLSARALPSYTNHQLSLLGATAVYTAAKYEEQRTTSKLNAKEIASYCGFTSAQEVTLMEKEMVAALDYRLGGPNAETFVNHFTRYSQGGGEEELRVQQLARAVADLSLKNYGCLSYLPSMVAAASISIARLTLIPPGALAWSTELQELTGYSSQDLLSCILTLGNTQ